MTEFFLTLTLVLMTSVGGGKLLWSEWNALRCEHQLFETTHAQLMGKTIKNTVHITENENFIEGSLRCNGKPKKISLSKLEYLSH